MRFIVYKCAKSGICEVDGESRFGDKDSANARIKELLDGETWMWVEEKGKIIEVHKKKYKNDHGR